MTNVSGEYPTVSEEVDTTLLPFKPTSSQESPESPEVDSPEQTLDSFFKAFSPAPKWDQLCAWPPDVFAISNLVLDHTEAYRFAVSPHEGQSWPPANDWNQRVISAAEDWRLVARPGDGVMIPQGVREQWAVLTESRHRPLNDLRFGRAERLCGALLTLHAMADEASRFLASEPERAFESRAWSLLANRGSLSRISPDRIRVLPKTHFPERGITIRSFSRYLAISYETVDLRWRRFESKLPPVGATVDRLEFSAILLPWPLHLGGDAFRSVDGPLENMDPGAYGFFEFAPETPLDLSLVRRLLEVARTKVQRVDALILPEAAVEPGEIPSLEALLVEHGVRHLFAGVRENARVGGLGRNYFHLGVLTGQGWERYEQAKHNRWCLDANQIRQYHLTRALAPDKLWWEAIELPEKTLQVLDVGGGATTVPLICEDLARLDEVNDLLRRLGPSMIIAVLLDGPQLSGRWPGRYASVLADDPGSAVLTLTSLGMAERCQPPGKPRSRTVAMWNDARTGLHELNLERGASGILLTASEGRTGGWTADGRQHESPELVLTKINQLRVPSTHRHA